MKDERNPKLINVPFRPASIQFDLASITDKLAEVDDGMEPPKIKLGDASCAAPFTSKLSNVSASKFCDLVSLGRSSFPAEADCSLFFVRQLPTSSDKVDALSSPPSRCTRSLLSTVLSPPTRSRFSTSTGSSSEITRFVRVSSVPQFRIELFLTISFFPFSAFRSPSPECS